MCIQLLLIFAYDFLPDCPLLMHVIGIHYVQHLRVMLECGVCELVHSFFHLNKEMKYQLNSTMVNKKKVSHLI